MTSALLVMDVQNGIVEGVPDQAGPLLETLTGTLAAAREAGVPVVYVRVAFREGVPEASPRNKIFAGLAGRSGFSETDHGTQIHPAVAPQPGEVVATKRRVSAFAGSDLDVILRARDVDSLVLSGISTSGVVLSTLRQAADLDFELTVLRDGCADRDPEVHRVLMDKVFPRQATVCSAADWVGSLA
jgi:nicotinamidase-related amidase